MALNFDKYAQEGNEFMNNLARELGHPDELGRAGIILRAVLHTLRNSITVNESLHLIAQLPMALKAIYVDNWTYRDKPLRIKRSEDFFNEVKKHQEEYGEQKFDWDIHTHEITRIVLKELSGYISEGEGRHIMAQFPEELNVFEESLQG